eukprot:gene28926-37317_t
MSDWAAVSARALLAVTMFFTFPMECFVARQCVLRVVGRLRQHDYVLHTSGHGENNNEYGAGPEHLVSLDRLRRLSSSSLLILDQTTASRCCSCDSENVAHFVTSVCLWLSAVGAAVIFQDLGVVLSFTGAVAASILAYILPA